MATEKRLIFIAVVMILMTMLCGFYFEPKDSPPDRFTISVVQKNIEIITDTETEVQYIAYRTPYGTGVTKLESAKMDGDWNG